MKAKMNDEDDERPVEKNKEDIEMKEVPEFTVTELDTTVGSESTGAAEQPKTFWERLRERWAAARQDMKKRPWTYISIPIVAGLVGYITNYIGIKMLFYPIRWTGIPLLTWPEQPFGLFGWQGIVPAKRFKMASSMIDVTISNFLNVSEVFNKLDPSVLASLMTPTVNGAIFNGMIPNFVMRTFLSRATANMMKDIEKVANVRTLAISGLTEDPTILGSFFQKMAKKELAFLVNSGLYFGVILGILQMVQHMLLPKNWMLPIGGAIVGFLTNWIALKWIFEPVNPVHWGPFVFQGIFLKR
jgi:uncharacterized membrane protein YheB (UPF0754 family)